MQRAWTIAAVGLAMLTAADTAAWSLPDAAIARITLAGEDLRDGDRVPVSVELANRGDSPLPSAPVVLTIDHEPYAEWRPPAQLSPGNTAVWSLVWTAARGSHLVVAAADPLNDVVESDEGNNSMFINVGVAEAREPSAWPALLVGGAGLLFGFAAAALLRKRRPASPPPRPRAAATRRPDRDHARYARPRR